MTSDPVSINMFTKTLKPKTVARKCALALRASRGHPLPALRLLIAD